VDPGVEAGGEYGAEPAVPDAAEVDVADAPGLEGVGDHPRRGGRVPQRHAQRAGEVVAGAGGDESEWGPGADDGLEGEVRHAVAADGDQGAGAFLEGGARPGQGVRGVVTEDGPYREAGVAQRG